MQGVMEQILQGIFLIALLGVIFVVLFQVVKALGGLFLIGLIGGILFMEIYGIYLFFTERYLYVEDLVANGIWSFTSFYIIFNILLVAGLVAKVVKSRIA
ncbi:DUF5966 family protein [Streptococcus vestibularis]|uniref:DUF5966 family protein n=1 Tax=Streptococcus vestibularis TaxID=1343 RepID=UPI001D0B5A12|nr:DUF5966 family protein [Streptococcus vestibularis]MCB8555796.1 DUF5966 family protein [Streptococcus vestibularis]MCB8586759.1 DUF5966 family protein [Streptococcus vestibularis]